MNLSLYFLFAFLFGCEGFRSPFAQRNVSPGRKCSTLISSSRSHDDYSNSNEKKNDYWTNLSSPFPTETPSGLRGEAIVRALQSGRTVVYRPPQSKSFVVRGSGAEHFLNQKLSQRIRLSESLWHRAAILNRRGHVIDIVGVACVNATLAVLFPTHLDLEQHWGPTIFPLDQVTVKSQSYQYISVFSTRHWHVQSFWNRYLRRGAQPVLSRSKTLYFPQSADPTSSQSLPNVLLTTPGSIWWPTHTVAASYTMIISANQPLEECLFREDNNAQGSASPLWLGEREYQALRIVSGQPAFGLPWSIPPLATVLEWELSSLVDFEKGCYLGQERVAAQLNNPLPQSLYQIEFLEDENRDFAGIHSWPAVNDTVYVLGSNEALAAGKIVEIAEPASQGTPALLGLVLVKRANSLLRRIEQLELDLPPKTDSRDVLDGLEVIVKGELIGRLKTLPFKLLGQNEFLIDDLEQAPDEEEVQSETTTVIAPREETKETNDSSDESMAPPVKIDSKAERERKEAKMEMLRKRAEEAMARRQQKKSQS